MPLLENPPFLGGSRIRKHLGDDYASKLSGVFLEVKDQADFCSYWFRLAHDCIGEDGRVGLVATNSIREIKSKAASRRLYKCQRRIYAHEAISSQPWSGEANVFVSIVNWAKRKPLLSYLDDVQVSTINTSLQSSVDLSHAGKLKSNIGLCWEGAKPTGKGFIVTKDKIDDWLKADPINKDVLNLFSMGFNLAKNPGGVPTRWIIDFNDRSIEEASQYSLPFEHVRLHVKPQRDKNRRKSRRLRWWRYGENAPKMRAAIAPLSRYFVAPRVSKWAIFIAVESGWLLGEKTVVVVSDDFYVLGILLSDVHRTWMHAQKSSLKGDIAYTPSTCFETFPFPQTPAPKIVQRIRSKALELDQYRNDQMEQKQWGITKLYNAYFTEPASQLCKLHYQLDALVKAAYTFKDGGDILAHLLALNLNIAGKEECGENVVGPWAPANKQL